MLGVIKVKREFLSSVYEFVLSNKKTVFLSCLFLVGVFLGTSFFSASSADAQNSIASLCSLYINARMGKSFYDMFISSFMPVFLMYAVLFFMGFCAVSHPIIILTPLFYGLGIGFTAAYLYTSSNGVNLILALFILMPASVISGFTVIMASRSSLYLASCFFSKLDVSNNRDLIPVLKRYFFQYIVYAVLCAVFALLNAGAFYVIFNLK